MSYDKVQVGNRIRGSRLEKRQRNLGVDHLGRLSDAMEVSSDFLLKGCSENRPGLGKGVSACLCFWRKGKD